MPDITLPGTVRPLEEPVEQAPANLTGDEVLAFEKQQRLTDTLVTGRAELDAGRLYSDAFDHLLEDDDPSGPDFVTRSDAEATKIEDRVIAPARGRVRYRPPEFCPKPGPPARGL